MIYEYKIITEECMICGDEKQVFHYLSQDILICQKCAQEIADILAGKRLTEVKE